MSAASKYLVDKFKGIFGWDQYLIVKPLLVDEDRHRIWFYSDMKPNTHYAEKILVGVSPVNASYGCSWLRLNKCDYDYRNSLMFDFNWKSLYGCYWKDFMSIGIHFNDLHNEKYNALVDAIFMQLCLIVDKGNDIVVQSDGILFKKNHACEMMIECELAI